MDPVPSPNSLFLESEWCMWEHRAPDKFSTSYEDNMVKLCDIATVKDFWNMWNNIPRPSQIFYDGRVRKKFADRTVDAFSLFKKNIKPEWEDPANRAGAEWVVKKPFPMKQLDEYWLNLALGLIGETVDPADEICGARVVDKSVVGKGLYRIELWFRKKDPTVAEELLTRTQELLGKSSVPGKWEFRPH